jgi:hypothetical protein
MTVKCPRIGFPTDARGLIVAGKRSSGRLRAVSPAGPAAGLVAAFRPEPDGAQVIAPTGSPQASSGDVAEGKKLAFSPNYQTRNLAETPSSTEVGGTGFCQPAEHRSNGAQVKTTDAPRSRILETGVGWTRARSTSVTRAAVNERTKP